MGNIIINGILLIAFLIVIWQLRNIQSQLFSVKEQQADTKFALANIQELLIEYGQGSKNAEENTIKALNEICQALNNYFNVAGTYMNNSSFMLQNIAACMIPFIDSVKKSALENEDYEKVQECIQITKNLQTIVKL